MGKDATVYDEIDPAVTSVFVGYDKTECESTITVLTTETELTDALTDGQTGTIFTEETPFYGDKRRSDGRYRCDHRSGRYI